MWKRLWGTNLTKKVDRLGTYAAALAYCFVLSVIPFTVVSFALANEMVGDVNVHAYQETLTSVLPVENELAISRIIAAVQATFHDPTAKTVGFLFALYTSFNLMTQIVRTLLFIFDDPRRPYEWTWKIFLKTVALMAVWTFLMLILTGCSMFSVIVHNSHLQQSTHLLMRPWRVASDLVMIASLFGAFFVTYYLTPSRRFKPREVRDGALLASMGWIACSLVFTKVIPHLLDLNLVYRALGSVVLILFWAQACAWSVIAGACWVVRISSRR